MVGVSQNVVGAVRSMVAGQFMNMLDGLRRGGVSNITLKFECLRYLCRCLKKK